jgi:hypothetical protein
VLRASPRLTLAAAALALACATSGCARQSDDHAQEARASAVALEFIRDVTQGDLAKALALAPDRSRSDIDSMIADSFNGEAAQRFTVKRATLVHFDPYPPLQGQTEAQLEARLGRDFEVNVLLDHAGQSDAVHVSVSGHEAPNGDVQIRDLSAGWYLPVTAAP